LKKVCYKVSLCKNCRRQGCRAFTGLSISANMIGGGRPLLREHLANTDSLAQRRFSIYTVSQKKLYQCYFFNNSVTH